MVVKIKQEAYLSISAAQVWVLLLLLCPFLAYTQKDCTSRKILCDTTQTIMLIPGAGEDTGEADNTCIVGESNSYWTQVNFSEGGRFLFDIIPLDTTADIDFVVYSWDGVDCTSRQLIRCMASGPQVSNGVLTTECLGPTGLREGETDVEETGGCLQGSNNYLAPVEVNDNSSLLLLINNFGMDTTTVELSLGGTAQVDCATSTENVSIDVKGKSSYQIEYRGSQVVLHVKDGASTATAYISGASGQLLQKIQLDKRTYYPITGLPSTGIYFITFVSGREAYTDRFYYRGSK
jgi:hypothetical protein